MSAEEFYKVKQKKMQIKCTKRTGKSWK